MNTSSEQEQESDVELRPLPTGWKWASLGELGLVRLGKTPRKSDYRDLGDHKIVKFRDVDEHGQVDWYNPVKGFVDSSPDVLNTLKDLRQGDVLVTASAHMSEHIGKKVGIVANIPGQFKGAYVVGEILQVRAGEDVEPKWILYYLRSTDGYKAIQRRVYGVHLISSRAQNIEIPVAPLDQQKRIVAEIEKQFSRLDEAVANLKRVKANLKRYKAAVLKAAVEGRLVETEAELARREGRSYETGAQLLQRILETRRSQWQGKGKYKEPAAPDLTGLPELPQGWVWASVDQLVAHLTDGDHQAPPQTEKGIPFLVIGNVRRGEIDFSDTRFVGEAYYKSLDPHRQPKLGDLLYTLVGSYGIPVRVKTDKQFCIQRHMAILRPHKYSPMSYLTIAMASDNVFKQATAVATGTAQLTVPLAGLRRIAIPLPPIAEQERIVAEADRHLFLASELEAEVDANLSRARALNHAVLQKSFNTGNTSCES